MKTSHIICTIASCISVSCSFNDVEKNLTLPASDPAFNTSIESPCRRHICDEDLIIMGDSLFLSFGRERAVEEGVSLQEYDQIQQSLNKLNSKESTKSSSTKSIDPSWARTVFAAGVIFNDPSTYFSGYNPCSPSIGLPYSYNVLDAVGVDCSFSSATDGSPLLHTLIVRNPGSTIYGFINGDEYWQYSENYQPVSWPIVLEYYCPVYTYGYSACVWKMYGFNS